MKILFLDFDGVLNYQHMPVAWNKVPAWVEEKFGERWPFTWISGEKVRLLSHLCDIPGFRIVISSTWRKSWTKDQLDYILGYYAADLKGRVIGMTPALNTERTAIRRGMEINMWIDKRMESHGDVESYCILDDDSDMLPDQQTRFVKTSFLTGLGDNEMLNIRRILGTPL